MTQNARRSTTRLIEVCFDVAGLLLSWRATIELRVLLNPYMPLSFSDEQLQRLAPPITGLVFLWLMAGLWLRAKPAKSPRRKSRVGDSLVSVAESTILASALAIVVTFFSRHLGAGLSRSFIVLLLPISFVILIIFRYAALFVIVALEDRWLGPERVAVLGEESSVQRFVDRLRSTGFRGITVTGAILPKHCVDGGAVLIPVLGTTARLAEVINRTHLDRIVLTGAVPDYEAAECSAISQRMGVVLSHAIAPMDGRVRLEFGNLCGMPLVDLRPMAFTHRQKVIKRIFDILVSASAILALSPLMLLIVALIKLTSAGPVLYTDWRVGKGGRHFLLLKFRSMYMNSGRSDLAKRNDKSGHLFKLFNDPRVTRIGRVLRKYSLDELPQLINVFQGDMSLVGPRPLPATDLDPDGQSREFRFWSDQRSRVLPGITGLWQISGRSDLSFEQMIELDLEYIRDWSLGLDLRILLNTPFVVISGKGAY